MNTQNDNRLIKFEGTRNFRDLGGYKNADGRTVKKGLLFRSDSLVSLSDKDLEKFAGLGIKTILDFRSAKEIETSPNRLPEDSEIAQLALSITSNQMDNTVMIARLLSGDIEGLDTEEYMLNGYRNLRRCAPQYTKMFELIADSRRLPLLFHCAGGKDRTGRAAAYILHSLSVSKEIIYEDFLLTNTYLKDSIAASLKRFKETSKGRTPMELVDPLLGVKKYFLDTTYDCVDKEFGSLDNYLEQALGVNDEVRARLKNSLLE